MREEIYNLSKNLIQKIVVKISLKLGIFNKKPQKKILIKKNFN